jgi:RNA polymerase sigma factor (sigma-70 family)
MTMTNDLLLYYPYPGVYNPVLRPVNFLSWYYLCAMADRERFLDFFLPVEPSLVRYVRAMAGNNEDAKDIVAETVLTALEKFEEITKEESFKYFLFTIAKRTYRRTVIKKRLFIPLDKKHEEISYDSDAVAGTSYDVALLLDAIHKLPFKMREAVSLFEFGGLSLSEIRDLQGGSLSGVKTRIARGRMRLKASLADLAIRSTSQISDEPLDAKGGK